MGQFVYLDQSGLSAEILAKTNQEAIEALKLHLAQLSPAQTFDRILENSHSFNIQAINNN